MAAAETYSAADLTLEQACDDIASRTAISDHHPNAHEGKLAFKEKRAPRQRRDALSGRPPR
jgi:2-(1,2-epoxy-1,2-dihydrophenyl)acetyl-CoA isomerase